MPCFPIPARITTNCCPFCSSREFSHGFCPCCETHLPSLSSFRPPAPFKKRRKAPPVYIPSHDGIADPISEEAGELTAYEADLDRLDVPDTGEGAGQEDNLPTFDEIEEALPWS